MFTPEIIVANFVSYLTVTFMEIEKTEQMKCSMLSGDLSIRNVNIIEKVYIYIGILTKAAIKLTYTAVY